MKLVLKPKAEAAWIKDGYEHIFNIEEREQTSDGWIFVLPSEDIIHEYYYCNLARKTFVVAIKCPREAMLFKLASGGAA